MMKRLMLGGLLVLVALATLGATNLSSLVRWSMTPDGPFDAAHVPDVPDYTSDDSWSALPDRSDAADAPLQGETIASPTLADVFYVHPTTYVGASWNAPTTDASLNEATDRVATRIQATAFRSCCAIYAPRYRQTNGLNYVQQTADGDRAADLAYQDVRRAFLEFQRRRDASRPFILAAHSQGSVLSERLLREEIVTGDARGSLVAAYLLGSPMTQEGLQEAGLKVCESLEQTGCVVGWNARGPGYEPGEWELTPRVPGERVCVEPHTWFEGPGAVFMEEASPEPRNLTKTSRCARGTLFVALEGRPPRDLMSQILDRVLGSENYHPIEYQLFFLHLRADATRRARAHLR